ncbi:spore coat protein [Virgibacillus sp. DJP39]|uniref:spore coat protein n=1 Tax=Virgibacillus sp. DJP39 TaxID=3409790 RepID=UPI003BB7A4BE
MQMQNQNQNQNLKGTSQMPAQISHGGHELLDTHEALSTLIGSLEQYVLYEQHIESQELKTMQERHRQFMSQLYNTIIETLKTGQEPTVDTQIYHMDQSNDVIYGMKPSAPKAPIQSVGQLNDQCISGYMQGVMKSTASAFTMTALEVTNPVLRRVFADSVPNLIEMSYEIFLYQNKNQYYQVPQLPTQDMQTIMNSYAPIQGNMPH